MPAKLTPQEFAKRLKPNDPRIDKDNYYGLNTRYKCLCVKHGEYSKTGASLLKGQRCRTCFELVRNKDQTHTFEHTAKRGAKIWPDYTFSRNGYVNAAGSIKYKCPEHGWSTGLINNLINKKRGCIQCAHTLRGLSSRTSVDDFIDSSNKVHSNYYSYNKAKYKTTHTKLTITCPKHGDFSQEPAAHLSGQGCHKCFCTQSNIESKVFNFVSRHTAAVASDRLVLKPQEIDIWCPTHKLGIEVNGMYWHSAKHKTKTYHYDKALSAKRAGVNLLQFWEHELHDKSAVCKSIIKSHLGQNERWYARQLTVEAMKPAAAREFFNHSHLQGYANASVTYGLFNGTTGECLAAMSFGRPRFNKQYEWEIVRFANVLNTTVVGGASRLFTYFQRENKPKSVITYADLRISQGQLYKTLGFEFSHVSDPNYSWYKGSVHLPRYKCQKHKLKLLLGKNFTASSSESVNMENNGWLRVYDAGNLVFTLTTKVKNGKTSNR